MPKFELVHPIYVISKGRHDCCLTADYLVKEKVPFRLVIEPQELEKYLEKYNRKMIDVLPFSNLGLGSIPARNWVWENSKEKGFKRHWILDDNIRKIYARFKGERIPCDPTMAFSKSAEFIDRYENIAIGGMNYSTFAMNTHQMPPFYLNTHVYSCLNIRNDLPIRWRGRYNEDTDLCLQALSLGYCTVLMNAFLIDKMPTMTMKGGNMTELYKGDGRLKMARALERNWPGVVETKRRFKRPQHVIKNQWKNFDTQLVRRKDIDWKKIEKRTVKLRLEG